MITIDALGEQGIIKDIQPHRLQPNAWSDGLNVRFRNGELGRTHGETAIAELNAYPLYLVPLIYLENFYWIICTTSGIYLWDGEDFTDITPLDDSAFPSTSSYPSAEGIYPTDGRIAELNTTGWNGGVVAGVAVLNPEGATVPYYYSPTMERCKTLPGWDSTWRAKVIRPYKNFWIAANMTEDSFWYPTRYRWSSAAEPGAIPTEWVASATNTAGDDVLEESQGAITDLVPLRDYLMIYKEDATALMTYVGGTFVLDNRMVFKTRGILSTDCAIEFNAKHFVVTQGDVVVHNGQDVESIAEGLIRQALFDDIDLDNLSNVFVVPNFEGEEIWVCYPYGTTYASRAAIWNWRSGKWTFRNLPNVAHIAYGILPEQVGNETWDLVDLNWNQIDTNWSDKKYNPAEQSMLMAQPIGGEQNYPSTTAFPSNSAYPGEGVSILLHVDVGSLFGGENYLADYAFPATDEYPSTESFPSASNIDQVTEFSSWVERRGLKPGDKSGVFMCRAVYPRGEGGLIKVTLGAHDSPASTIRWSASNTFELGGSSDKIDTRTTGRYLAYRIDLYKGAVLYGADFDIVQVGSR